MLKKVFALTLALLMALSMVACSSSSSSSKNESTKTETETPVEDGTIVADPKYPDSGVLNGVCAYSAGGGADNITRQVGMLMSEYLKCASNVVNVTGGSGSVAGLNVLETGKDGYTCWGGVMPAPSSWHVLGFVEGSQWSDWYHFIAGEAYLGFYVNKDSNITSMDELIAAANANPGTLKWGHSGIGTAVNLSAEMLLKAVGISDKVVSVPYGGGREAATNLIAGEIDFQCAFISDIPDFLSSGDLVCIGTNVEGGIEWQKNDGTSYHIPDLNGEYPDACNNSRALGIYGVSLPRYVEPEKVQAFKEAFEYAVNTDEFKDFMAGLNQGAICVTGVEADKMMSEAESVYAWALYDAGLNAEGKSPEDLGIPRIEDYDYSKVDYSDIAPWPNA